MWKYVGQCLKDSAEQTCSHIKNLRSTFSTCKQIQEAENRQGVRRFEITRDGRNYNVWATLDSNTSPKNVSKKSPFDIDAPYIIQKCYEKQKQKQQAFGGRLECCSILQWTAGILCSVYFGQMMCLYSRRRQNLKRWKHMEQLLIERSLQQSLSIYSSIYQKSYVPSTASSGQHNWYDADQMRGMRALMTLMPVINEHRNEASTYTTATQTMTDKNDINVAVDNLIATLGNIEFRLGMQNLQANEPEVAVSHLKLATTHRHPEGTFNLGVCYEMGIGIDKSMRNAMECYRLAANLGHKKAMYNLGVFYVHGRGGLKKNHVAARACFDAANKLGLRQAQIAVSIPERPVKKDEEIFWKSNDMISNRLGAVNQRRQSSAT